MISLHSILSKSGISIDIKEDPKKVLSILSSAPTILAKFPAVSSAVSTLNTLINAYDTAKSALQSATDKVEEMEKALKLAQKTYDVSMSTLPGSYVAPTTGGPVTPGASSGYMATLELAYTALDQAKEILQKAQEKVNEAEAKLKSQVSSIVDLIFKSKVA